MILSVKEFNLKIKKILHYHRFKYIFFYIKRKLL